MDDEYKLSKEERDLIDKYLYFYESLASGKRKPSTEEQQHFVKVCKGKAKADTIHELAYAKYRMELVKIQREKKRVADQGIPEHEEGTPGSDWFTDSDWNNLHPDRRQH